MVSIRKCLCLFLLWLTMIPFIASGQHVRTFNNTTIESLLMSQGTTHHIFKLSVVAGLKKGVSFGLGYGIWEAHPFFQYSLNTAVQWRLGRRFLGNYYDRSSPNDNRSKSQLVFTFAPLLTMNLTNSEYHYQELESFYLGTPNAVYSNYKNSLTVGTTFTISPRGTYKNIATTRNRAQQDLVLALNIGDFNLTLYDDYFPYLTEFLQLGDNWDRYFTGGGFVRYRFNENYTLHLYSEVYTGINKPAALMNQDIISYKYGKRKRWTRQNYANQNAGQEYFNSSWLVAKLSYSGTGDRDKARDLCMPSVDLIVGSSAPWTMFSQNAVHNRIPYDSMNSFKLHHFLNRSNIPGNLNAGGSSWLRWNMNSLFVGAGFNSNIIVQ